MKLLRFGPSGREKPGLLDSDGFVRDLSSAVNDIAGDALGSESLAKLKEIDPATLPKVPGIPQVSLRLGPCVDKVGKFICIGLNYAGMINETGADTLPEPAIVGKWTSAIIGPDDDVQIPRGSVKTDWEVELGVVIGEGGTNIEEKDAMSHVAGFCVVNDISERDFQFKRSGTWSKGKGCDTFGPIGPWLVTPDEVENCHNLAIWLEVDGHRYQNDSTSTMIHKVPYLVSYCSIFMNLQPGDIISTGSPAGTGMGQSPRVYLKGGEIMRLGIDNLGIQTQKVRSWS